MSEAATYGESATSKRQEDSDDGEKEFQFTEKVRS
jgi:hypothetical protein